MSEKTTPLNGNSLSDEEIKRLHKLQEGIILSFDCDINGTGIPCHTDRFEAIELMKEYLEIHNLKVTESECKLCTKKGVF